MRRRDGKQPPDTDRSQAGSGDGSGWTWSWTWGWTWIWRGRHGLRRNYTRRCFWALAGDDQETHDAAGACSMS